MSYEKFVEEIADIIRSRTDGDVGISVHTATKNNGCERKGITFSKEGSTAAPTIYLEGCYKEYIEGDSLEEIGMRILGAYHKAVQHGWGEKAAEHVRDYQNIKDKIIYRLVNRERNKEILPQVPHEDYLDLAVLFYVMADIDETGGQMATMRSGTRTLHCGAYQKMRCAGGRKPIQRSFCVMNSARCIRCLMKWLG